MKNKSLEYFLKIRPCGFWLLNKFEGKKLSLNIFHWNEQQADMQLRAAAKKK